MIQFLQITRFEFRTAVRRWGVWLAFGIAGAFTMAMFFTSGPGRDPLSGGSDASRQLAGQMTFMLNAILCVVAGIVISDRLLRDTQTGFSELRACTPTLTRRYLAAKYAGSLLSLILPALAIDLLMGVITLILYPYLSLSLLANEFLAFATISLPSLAFLTAFSLAGPLVMPLRVYQILFTGYWFWGNFLHPTVMPTLSHTPLAASGKFALSAFFGVNMILYDPVFTPADVALNLAVLAVCTLAALLAARVLLDRKAALA